MKHYIGIDISKSRLQVYIPKNEIDLSIENSMGGLRRLLSKLKKLYAKEEVIWIFEPTGSYSELTLRFCHEQGIRCFVVKPSQSAAFSRTIKNRNKTDMVDARMLQRMHTIARPDDIRVPEYDAVTESLRNLIRYYRMVVKDRIAKTNQLEAALHRGDDAMILRKLRHKIKRLKTEERELIKQMSKKINANKNLQERFGAITSFPGIGQMAGIVLLDLFMRYPNASIKEITALVGLDPIEISSGSSIKRRSRISKQGSRLVRATLFMAVLVAIKHNPLIQAFYERLKANGKHTTVAQIAVMRKMVTIAFALFKNKEHYSLEKHRQKQQAIVA